mmetsp:Transcript_102493/g.260317  ORF Transcript_102493/g.260317 Transcript_102493/m.260317 type:complete len:206 (-) Transcript_102493:13-630(-)
MMTTKPLHPSSIEGAQAHGSPWAKWGQCSLPSEASSEDCVENDEASDMWSHSMPAPDAEPGSPEATELESLEVVEIVSQSLSTSVSESSSSSTLCVSSVARSKLLAKFLDTLRPHSSTRSETLREASTEGVFSSRRAASCAHGAPLGAFSERGLRPILGEVGHAIATNCSHSHTAPQAPMIGAYDSDAASEARETCGQIAGEGEP